MASRKSYKVLYLELLKDVREQYKEHKGLTDCRDFAAAETLRGILSRASEREDQEFERVWRSYL